jgi:hypothetical protein
MPSSSKPWPRWWGSPKADSSALGFSLSYAHSAAGKQTLAVFRAAWLQTTMTQAADGYLFR